MTDPRPEVATPEAAAVWANVGDLHPDPRNPRDNAAAVDKVAASIKRFGFASPIVAREADGMVIAGHTRLAAAKALGLDVVPVRFVDLDPADARLLNLADNRLGEIADWRTDDLGALLRELRDDGLDLDVVGFDDDELDALLAGLGDLGGGGGDGSGEPGALPSPPIAGADVRHAPHLVNGEALAALREMPDNSVDAVITDPPYGLGFMGRGWDAPDMAWAGEWARECLRVLKPGGHLLAWSSDRTDHRIKVALEDAGFQLRRTFAWVTWQGFPKNVAADLAIDKHLGRAGDRPILGRGDSGSNSGTVGEQGHDVTAPATDEARRWYGYGTDVKPANEPAILARKPLEGTLAENLLKWGCGALHIDAARHKKGDPMWLGPTETPGWAETARAARAGEKGGQYADGPSWGAGGLNNMAAKTPWDEGRGRFPSNLVFCPKAGAEREWGCEGLPDRTREEVTGREVDSAGQNNPRASSRRAGTFKNHHPTVKPIALCRWFVRLLAPGPGSVIVDTFAGSGSLVVAAIVEGHRAVGIEREGDKPDAATGSAGLGYFAILEARANAALEGGAAVVEAAAADEGAT